MAKLLKKMHACEWNWKILKIYHILLYFEEIAFTSSCMLKLIMHESKDVEELEG